MRGARQTFADCRKCAKSYPQVSHSFSTLVVTGLCGSGKAA
ncbi:hypothetical protein EPIB1_2183 [Tritonibacter mobilis]|nr:hypothetical protein EPIB1_2183 [Tritonibacter mobilis]